MKVIDILGIKFENAGKYGAIFSSLCKLVLWMEVIQYEIVIIYDFWKNVN